MKVTLQINRTLFKFFRKKIVVQLHIIRHWQQRPYVYNPFAFKNTYKRPSLYHSQFFKSIHKRPSVNDHKTFKTINQPDTFNRPPIVKVINWIKQPVRIQGIHGVQGDQDQFTHRRPSVVYHPQVVKKISKPYRQTVVLPQNFKYSEKDLMLILGFIKREVVGVRWINQPTHLVILPHDFNYSEMRWINIVIRFMFVKMMIMMLLLREILKDRVVGIRFPSFLGDVLDQVPRLI